MAINFDKVKAKFEAEQKKAAERANRGDFQKIMYWKPEPGTSKVRVMPPWATEGHNADQFWREMYNHWRIGESDENSRSFSCAKKTPGSENTDCIICDYVDQLKASNDPADVAQAKEFRAKQQFYMNIVDYDDAVYTAKDVKEWNKDPNNKDKECPFQENQSKVQVWSFGVGIFRDILSIFNAAVTSGFDLSDLDSGRAIIINRTGKGQMDTKYQIQADFTNTAFEFNAGAHEYLEDALYNLDNLFPFPTEEKVLEMLPAAASLSKALPAPKAESKPKALASKAKAAPEPEEEAEEAPAPKKPAMKSRRPAAEAKVDDVADLEAMLKAELNA